MALASAACFSGGRGRRCRVPYPGLRPGPQRGMVERARGADIRFLAASWLVEKIGDAAAYCYYYGLGGGKYFPSYCMVHLLTRDSLIGFANSVTPRYDRRPFGTIQAPLLQRW